MCRLPGTTCLYNNTRTHTVIRWNAWYLQMHQLLHQCVCVMSTTGITHELCVNTEGTDTHHHSPPHTTNSFQPLEVAVCHFQFALQCVGPLNSSFVYDSIELVKWINNRRPLITISAPTSQQLSMTTFGTLATNFMSFWWKFCFTAKSLRPLK